MHRYQPLYSNIAFFTTSLIHPGSVTDFPPGGQTGDRSGLRGALSRKHNYIGCEHLLLGLLREGGAAAQILTELGVELEHFRQEVFVVTAPWVKVLDAEHRLEELRAAYRSFLGRT